MEEKLQSMPILPLREVAVYPDRMTHFEVGKGPAVQALSEAMETNSPIFLVALRGRAGKVPKSGELYTVGVICGVKQVVQDTDGGAQCLIEGISRGSLYAINQQTPYLKGTVGWIMEKKTVKVTPKVEALIRTCTDLFEQHIHLSGREGGSVLVDSFDLLANISEDEPGFLADYIAQNCPLPLADKQAVLEEVRPVQRLELVVRILEHELKILEIQRELAYKARGGMIQSQREHFLREEMRLIQDELGGGEGEDEGAEYRRKIAALKAPQEVKDKLLKELSRLEKQPFGSAEGAVGRSYLDLCLELPWGERTKERLDVEVVRKALDKDHYGLDKVKERVLEYLAVKQLSPELKSQILCLVGPPGVGKTSVALSIARATRRKLCRVSLGGVHDEAEIRGHRKTYVGAMPGRILEAIRQAGSCNPLMVLDEIDKLGNDSRSDPSSALLEVLDPEQNSTFRDHFVEVPFDLSEVMFITTANTTDTIPKPLLDRMEVIELPSYTDEEKVHIAREHLLPKERKRHGLTAAQLRVNDRALRSLISGYTREAGVRSLERELAALCRKAAMRLVTEDVKSVSVTEKELPQLLGPRKFHPEGRDRGAKIGVVNGLAWTSVGGELLEVEAIALPGTGKLVLTGNLGDVMKESCQAALSYIRAHAKELGVEEDFYKTKDLHLHFPEGATPKDGPSAGIAILTALVSALTETPVRGDVAMTGEITLRGRVLPIGGLREKTMGALREGVTTVILPEDNLPDLEEIDPLVRQALRFLPVTRAGQVLTEALAGDPSLFDMPLPKAVPAGAAAPQ